MVTGFGLLARCGGAPARRRPAPPARRAAGNSVRCASRPASAATRSRNGAWRRRRGARAPGRAPVRRAVRRVPSRTSRPAPRHRGPRPRMRGELAQFVEHPGVVGQAERLLGLLEQAAQLAGGDPHLVHRVVGVGAHRAVPLDELGRPVRRPRGESDRPGGGACVRRRAARHPAPAPASSRGRRAPHRRRAAGCSAGPADQRADVGSHVPRPARVPTPASAARRLRRTAGRRGDLVIAEFGHRRAVGTVEQSGRCGPSRCGRPATNGRSRTIASTTSRSSSGTVRVGVGPERQRGPRCGRPGRRAASDASPRRGRRCAAAG